MFCTMRYNQREKQWITLKRDRKSYLFCESVCTSVSHNYTCLSYKWIRMAEQQHIFHTIIHLWFSFIQFRLQRSNMFVVSLRLHAHSEADTRCYWITLWYHEDSKMFSLFPVTCESWSTVRDWGTHNNMLWMRGQVLLVLPCVQLPALAVVTQHNGNKCHKWLLVMLADVRTDIQSSYSQYLFGLKISYKVWILLGDPNVV